MLLNLQPLQSGEAATLPFELSFDIAGLTPDIISGTANVSGKVSASAGFMLFTAEAKLDTTVICARCAKEFPHREVMHFEAPVAVSLENEDNGDYLIAEGGILDLEAELFAFISLGIPTRFLCNDGCKGLCPHCGADLSNGDCGCKTDLRDKRWSALEGYFDKK